MYQEDREFLERLYNLPPARKRKPFGLALLVALLSSLTCVLYPTGLGKGEVPILKVYLPNNDNPFTVRGRVRISPLPNTLYRVNAVSVYRVPKDSLVSNETIYIPMAKPVVLEGAMLEEPEESSMPESKTGNPIKRAFEYFNDRVDRLDGKARSKMSEDEE